MIAPCKGCKDRSPECHGTCQNYIRWKADHDIKKAKVEILKAKERMKHEDIRKAVERNKR